MAQLSVALAYTFVRGLIIQCSPGLGLDHPIAALLPLFEAFDLHAFDEAP